MPESTFTFDNGAEGWRGYDLINNVYTDALLSYDAAGDRLQITDTPTGVSMFTTPIWYSGNQSDLIGGSVTFDVTLNNTGDTLEGIPVEIKGNNGNTIRAQIDVPDTDDNYAGTLTMELTPAFFGVSEARFNDIMEEVAHFGFTSDSQYGNETWYLDNVQFRAPLQVDGEDSSENMGVGYDDATGAEDDGGDQITNGNDTIYGNGGDDTISAGGGDDYVHGDNDGPQNLIVNSRFDNANNENPSGWTVNETPGSLEVQVFDGRLVFNGDNTATGGSVSQNVDGVASGETVTIRFNYSEAGTGVGSGVGVQVIDGNGTVLLNQTTDTVGLNEFSFLSTTSDYTVTIYDASTATSGSDPRVDDFQFIAPLSGDDFLDGGVGGDTIFGGDGDDTIIGGTNGIAGWDADSIDAGAGNDSVFGGGYGDVIEGGDGDDIIDGGFSTDTMDGGTGSDTVSYEQAFGGTEVVNLDLEAGTGQLISSSGTLLATETVTNFENAIGGMGDDTLAGTSGANRLEGGTGNDSLDGRAGSDTLIGGSGNDVLLGGPTAGTAGIDGADLLQGGTGNDTLDGGEGNDTLDGGEGDDVLLAGYGGDILRGGDGNDTVQIDGSAVDVIMFDITVDNSGNGTDTFPGTSNTYEGIEHFVASEANDVSVPGHGIVIAGKDTITMSDQVQASEVVDLDTAVGTFTPSHGGVAIAFGGPGQPSLQNILDGQLPDGTAISADGAYRVTSGDESGQVGNISFENFETINFTVAGSAVDGEATGENMGVGYDDATGAIDGGGDLITGGDDLVFGNGGNDTITAGSGNDTVFGGADNDLIDGGLGNDSLLGGDGNDSITGGDGRDTLSGGAGSDTLRGGDGDDVLIGGSDADTLIGGAGRDTVDMVDEGGTAFSVSVDDTGNGSDDQGNSFESVEHFRADDGGGDDTITLTDVALASDVQDLDGAIGEFTSGSSGATIAFGGPGEPP